jgi:hypothetical protein
MMVGYIKIIQSDKNVDLKIYILRSTRLSFLCSPKYKAFEHDFLHICAINSCLQPNMFSIILKTQNKIFDFLSTYTQAPNLHS